MDSAYFYSLLIFVMIHSSQLFSKYYFLVTFLVQVNTYWIIDKFGCLIISNRYLLQIIIECERWHLVGCQTRISSLIFFQLLQLVQIDIKYKLIWKVLWCVSFVHQNKTNNLLITTKLVFRFLIINCLIFL